MTNKETTEKNVTSSASKVLTNPNASKNAKSVAGSALTQTPSKNK